MIHDGLWCPFEGWHMGNAGETVADTLQGAARAAGRVGGRESSPRRRGARLPASSRTRSCRSRIPQKKGDPLIFDRDESVRADTTVEVLRGLKPAFKKDGTVTAGNAPPVNDGAAALVVMAPIARATLGRETDGAHRRAGHQRAGAEDAADDPGRGHAQGR